MSLLGPFPSLLEQQEENKRWHSLFPTLLRAPSAGADSLCALQCSARCGAAGTMKREVRCSVEAPLCDESRKPSSERECTGPPCDRRWTASDWGPVSAAGLRPWHPAPGCRVGAAGQVCCASLSALFGQGQATN